MPARFSGARRHVAERWNGRPRIHVSISELAVEPWTALDTSDLVEAAGVEPASEKVDGKEPTYVVAFRRRSYPATFAARAQNATRNASR